MRKIALALAALTIGAAIVAIAIVSRSGDSSITMPEQTNKIEATTSLDSQEGEPPSSDILILKAQSFENSNQYPKARGEFLEALKISPANAQLINELGEFYRRHGQYSAALQTWSSGLALPESGALWVKTLFWNKAVQPLSINWSDYTVPDGSLKPFIEYLLSLKTGEFWNDASFNKLQNRSDYLNAYQETFWLRVLSALENNREEDAQIYLDNNPFKPVSWAPELEGALRVILAYRQSGSLPFANTQEGKGSASYWEETHPFFLELHNARMARSHEGSVKPAESFQALLDSQEVYSAAFLAAGWLEAGLQLNKLDVIPGNFPDWYAFGLTQALQADRGSDAALDFAQRQKDTPALTLLISEILIAKGDVKAGLKHLRKLAQEDSEYGVRAAWLASRIELEEGRYDKARQTILIQPRLAQSVIGREALAKIALEQGDAPLADEIYAELQNDSNEAKLYLARKAVQEQDWPKADKLTRELLDEYPDNLELKADLEVISKHLSK